MYCIQCGVRLADSEKQCPLCGTAVFHPQLSRPEGERLYPAESRPAPQVSPWGVLTVLSVLFTLPLFITLLCDFQLHGQITWFGYVAGGVTVAYVSFVLPFWFRRPNPVIFIPAAAAAAALYVLFICLDTGGSWYLSFALPVIGGWTLLVTAAAALLRYVRGGELYIFGGACIAAGGMMLLMEFLIDISFDGRRGFVWSLYPLTVLAVLGCLLLLIAICPPLREYLRRKLFL